MRPKPRSRMPGRTRSISAIGERTSSRWASVHWSRVNPSGSGLPGGPPVFTTSTSTGPRSTQRDRPDPRRRRCRSCRGRSRWRRSRRRRSPRAPASASLIATRAPSASARAIPWPIPLEAPVTSAVLPCRPRSIGATVVLFGAILPPDGTAPGIGRAVPLVAAGLAAGWYLRRQGLLGAPARPELPWPPAPEPVQEPLRLT